MKVGYGVTGYPGAGKTTVGEMLQEVLGGLKIETGDVVRREARDHFGLDDTNGLTSDQLGEYSTHRREVTGEDYVGQDVVAQLEESPDFPDRHVVISGMRDDAELELFNEYFDRFTLIFVEATFETRLERLQERGRQDEGSFTEEDLRHRDEREDEWGVSDLHKEYDVSLINEGSLDILRMQVERVVEMLEQEVTQ